MLKLRKGAIYRDLTIGNIADSPMGLWPMAWQYMEAMQTVSVSIIYVGTYKKS